MSGKVVCPRCGQDWLSRVRLVFVNVDVVLCFECDATWIDEQHIGPTSFQDYGTMMKGFGRSSPEDPSEVEVLGPLLRLYRRSPRSKRGIDSAKQSILITPGQFRHELNTTKNAAAGEAAAVLARSGRDAEEFVGGDTEDTGEAGEDGGLGLTSSCSQKETRPKGRRDLSESSLPRVVVQIRDKELENKGKLLDWEISYQLIQVLGGLRVLMKKVAKYEVADGKGTTVRAR